MNTIIGRGFRRREVVLAWVPIGLASLPFTAAAIEPPSTTLANGARVAIVGDTLEIEGTPEDDRILITATRHPDAVRVIVNGEDRGHHGPIVRIEIHAGDGDDTVRVGERVELPVRIEGGPGDDRLRGGAGHDLVFGEDGDDVLFASRGRDALEGGPGSNQLRIGQPTERIWVGSATGEAARILAQAYRLVPLASAGPAIELGPIVVGPADLADASIADHLRTAYGAGHAIALTEAEAEHAETLRELLGHASAAAWSEDIPQTDLVAFRRAIRPDGGAHESTSILLPRQAVEGSPAEARRGGRAADLLAVEALSGAFSGTPVVPELAPGAGGACVTVPAGDQ
jgi:Ca2+-binding RTX toxin-like protein